MGHGSYPIKRSIVLIQIPSTNLRCPTEREVRKVIDSKVPAGKCDRFQEGGSQNNGSLRDEDTAFSHVFSRTKCGVHFTSIILSPVSYLSQVLFSWILSIRKESVFEDQKSFRFNGKVVVKIVGVLFRACSQWKSSGISLFKGIIPPNSTTNF